MPTWYLAGNERIRGAVIAASGAAVTVDATGTEARSSSAEVFLDYTGITVGAGANALLVMALFSDQSVSAITVTWDNGGTNQAMTSIVDHNTTGAHGRGIMFGLLSPTAGNKTLHLAWTTATQVFVCAQSYSGANSTFGTAFTGSFNTGTSATSTITVSSATGHQLLAGYCDNTANFNSTDATQLFVDNGGVQIAAAGQYTSGAASVTMNGQISGSDTWVAVAVDVAP